MSVQKLVNMEDYRFRHGALSLTEPIIGILFFIYPTYVRLNEGRDIVFAVLYLLTISYCIIEICFKLNTPIIVFQKGVILVKKYFFLSKKMEIEKIIEIERDSSDVSLISLKEKIKIDSKDIHKLDRVVFMKFIDEIKPNVAKNSVYADRYNNSEKL